MKERPILFSAPMVRAILEGRKTQTRRVVKHKGEFPPDWATFAQERTMFNTQQQWVRAHIFYWSEEQPAQDAQGRLRRWPIGKIDADETGDNYSIPCPYGKPGDQLWVKEAYYAWGKWVHNGKTKSGRQAWKFVQVGTSIRYMDGNKPTKTAKRDGECGWVYRHGRFMPKKHSRQTLEITDVRVQRLQEISAADAIAEGIDPPSTAPTNITPWRNYLAKQPAGAHNFSTPQRSYVSLWDSINGAGSADANPWVWAITFKRLEAAERAA